MTEHIRGIECALYNGRFAEFLLFLSNKSYVFFIKRCMKIDEHHTVLPKFLDNYYVTASDLVELSKNSIWELVMHIYPIGSNNQIIETYEDFIKSECVVSLVFYDCGLLDIYIKDFHLCQQFYNFLKGIGATDIEFITDMADGRTGF